MNYAETTVYCGIKSKSNVQNTALSKISKSNVQNITFKKYQSIQCSKYNNLTLYRTKLNL